MDPIDLQPADLLTVVGATAAAVIITQFAKALFNTSIVVTRTIALVTGVAVVMFATVFTGDVTDPISWLLALLVGMQAGLAASALYDTVRTGVDYQVAKHEENP